MGEQIHKVFRSSADIGVQRTKAAKLVGSFIKIEQQQIDEENVGG